MTYPTAVAIPTIGFNLGLELAQVVALALVIVPLGSARRFSRPSP